MLKLNIDEMVNINREHSEELSHILKYITDREAQDLLEITMRSVQPQLPPIMEVHYQESVQQISKVSDAS